MNEEELHTLILTAVESEFEWVEDQHGAGGILFATQVHGAPVQVVGCLGLNGCWYIGKAFKLTGTEDAWLAGLAEYFGDRLWLVLRNEPIAKAIIEAAEKMSVTLQ